MSVSTFLTNEDGSILNEQVSSLTEAVSKQTATPIVVENSGNYLVVEKGVKRPILDLITNITATQSGEGDASPESVKAIIGSDIIQLFQSNENLASHLDYEITMGHRNTLISAEVIDVVTPSVYDYGRIPITLKKGLTYTLVIDWEVYGREEGETGATRSTYRIRDLETTNHTNAVYENKTERFVRTYIPEEDIQTVILWYPNYRSEVAAASRSRIMLIVADNLLEPNLDFIPSELITSTMTLPETVYGGSFDWINGLLTIDKTKLTWDGTEDWELVAASDGKQYFRINQSLDSRLSTIRQEPTGLYQKFLCSHYSYVDYSSADKPANSITIYNGNDGITMAIRNDSWTSVDEGKAYLAEQASAGTPLSCVFDLAKSLIRTIQLEPQKLEMRQGYNTIWDSCGDVNLSYIADTKTFINDSLEENDDQLHKIILNTYSEKIPNNIYAIGGLQPDTGSTNGMTTRWRTEYFIPVGDYIITAQEDIRYDVFSYKVEGADFVTFLGKSDYIKGTSLVSSLLKEEANAFAVRCAPVDGRTVTENDFALLEIRRQPTFALHPRYLGGSIVAASGVEVYNASRCRTDYLPAEPLYVAPDEGYKFLLVYYDENKNYLSTEAPDWLSEPRLLTVPNNAAYLRVVAAYDDDRKTFKAKPYTTLCCGWHVNLYTKQSSQYLAACLDLQNADPYATYVSDVPENIGVLNTILNMKQMANVKYTPLANIPQKTNDLVAGTTYKGMVYSSSRPEMGFVPNCVSLHSFMTSIKNPNSYLYTVDLGELGNDNGDTYYGSVCSTMIGAALGIKEPYQTAQWASIPGMEPLDWQSPYALKLGDVVCTKGMGHVLMVIDITRNKRGKIGTITTMETGSYLPHTKMFTPDEFEAAYPTASWVYYRYANIHKTQHIQSPYVAVEDEIPQTVAYNTALIPRKGDKANWLAGVPVEIDVLESDNYTSVEVYKDDVLYSTIDIAALITLSDLPYGNYKARLTDGTNISDWCYWIVVDATSTATPTGNAGEINVNFNASNATPVYITWSRASDNYPRYISTPTAEELNAGNVTCTQESGSYKIRVAFETEYGIIHTALPDAAVTV